MQQGGRFGGGRGGGRGGRGGRGGATREAARPSILRTARENAEIAELERRIQQDAPPKAFNPLSATKKTSIEEKPAPTEGGAAAAEGDESYKVWYPSATMFRELPLCRNTLDALEHAEFTKLTDIQRASLPHALVGRDILGAAKTGSGKTLAFLVPVCEDAIRQRMHLQLN